MTQPELIKIEDPNLTDFSKSTAASGINARFCGCGNVHITMHDKDGVMIAHIDAGDPNGLMQFASNLLELGKVMANMHSVVEVETKADHGTL